jgi:perosamine synthetase
MMLPVSAPLLDGNEKKYLCAAIDAGEVSASGSFVRRLEEAFARWADTKYAIAVNSGTAALQTAMYAVNTQSISIPSGMIISALIAAQSTNTPVIFRDNEEIVWDKFTLRCHLFGELDPCRGEVEIDDCCQYWDNFTPKHIACYSLYANKIITCGEGGIITTNDATIDIRCRRYRDLSHSEEERFVHIATGMNARMSNLQAAVALAQLEQIDRFIEIKQKNRDLYKHYLPEKCKIRFDTIVPWMYLITTQFDAGEVVRKLLEKGVECRRFFYPLHRQPCLANGDPEWYFPIADYLRGTAFYLPSGLTLTKKEIQIVCKHLSDTLNCMKPSTEQNPTAKK